MKKATILLMISVLAFGSAALAGERKIIQKAPKINQYAGKNAQSPTSGRIIYVDYGSSSATPVAIDTAANAFGMYYSGVNPLMYDAASGNLSLAGRMLGTISTGTGVLGFAHSTDGGVTWTSQHDLNDPGHTVGARYPSLLVGGNIDGLDVPIIIYTEDNGGGGVNFGDPILAYDVLGYGGGLWDWIDFHAATPYPDLWGASPILTATGGIFTSFISFTPGQDHYLVYEGSTSNLSLAPNTDASIFPADVTNSVGDGLASVLTNTAYSYNSGNYIATGGAWDMNSFSSKPRLNDRNLVYRLSSDNGATWAAPVVIGETDIAGFPAQNDPGDAFFQTFATSMVVDNAGSVHFFSNIIEQETRQRILVSHIGQVDGVWTLHVIDILDFALTVTATCDAGCGLTQPFVTPSGILALAYTAGTTTADTLPNGLLASDIFVSYSPDGGVRWSPPENITNSPGINETKVQGSPIVEVDSNGDEWLHIVYFVDVEEPLDDELGKHTYYYLAHKLVIVDLPIGVSDRGGKIPTSMVLEQNFPNPFNPTTSIGFSLEKKSDVSLTVFNILGQEIATLFDGVKEAGDHNVVWDASEVVSGIYFYKLSTADGLSRTKKMVLLK